MLKWNADKVKQLTGAEIWMMIIGRVFVAFGIGAVCMREFPQVTGAVAIPVIVVGAGIFAIAARGMARPKSEQGEVQS